MLFISDSCPNECDTDRFVDDYMRLKKDGHTKFYTKDDWTDICCNQGLIILDSFESSIRFPKKKDTAFGYETVLMKHDKIVIDSYDLAETDTELYITERVNNILFMNINSLSSSYLIVISLCFMVKQLYEYSINEMNYRKTGKKTPSDAT